MIAPSPTALQLRDVARAPLPELDAPASATPWRTLLGWLLVGLAIRLLIAPFAVHPDLLAVYDRTRLLSQGTLHWFDLHFQALPIGLHWLFAKTLDVALPVLDGLHWPTPAREDVYAVVTREMARPGALLMLGLWKLPYVLADLGCGVVCSRLASPAQRTATLRAWMLHPFLIYVTALFGKYEALMALPFLLGWLQLRRGREERAFLLFGVSIALRLYPVVFVLPMVLCADRSLRRRLELLALSLLPIAVVVICCATRSGASWLLVPTLAFVAWRAYLLVRRRRWEWVAGAAAGVLLAFSISRLAGTVDSPAYPMLPVLQHTSYFVRDQVVISSTESIVLFLGAYGLVLLWALRVARLRGDGAGRYEDVGDAGLLATLAFVSFGSSLSQYQYLVVPLMLIQFRRCREARLAHALQLAGLLLLLLDSRDGDRTTLLPLPLAPDVVALTHAPQQLLADATWDTPWIAVGRTLLVLGSVWMAIDLFRARARREPAHADPRPARFALAASALAWPVGLLWLTSLTLRSGGVEPVGPEQGDAAFTVARPLDGYEFSVGDQLPTCLQIRLEENGPVPMPGHLLRVERVDPRGDASTVADPQDLLVPAESLIPDEDGTLRIDLSGLDLAPHGTYVVHWQQRIGFGTADGVKLRLQRALPAGALLDRFLVSARRRLFDDGALGAAWLAGALLLALAGGGLVASTAVRRARSSLACDPSPPGRG